MSVHSNATKEVTTFVFYKSNVAEEAGITINQLEKFESRLFQAFEMGEPVWMIAQEMSLRATTPKKSKTPKQLAISFTRISKS